MPAAYALDSMLALDDGSCELSASLVDGHAGILEVARRAGSLAELEVAEVMRECESERGPCSMYLQRGSETASLRFEGGELFAINGGQTPAWDALAGLARWVEGYVLVVFDDQRSPRRHLDVVRPLATEPVPSPRRRAATLMGVGTAGPRAGGGASLRHHRRAGAARARCGAAVLAPAAPALAVASVVAELSTAPAAREAAPTPGREQLERFVRSRPRAARQPTRAPSPELLESVRALAPTHDRRELERANIRWMRPGWAPWPRSAPPSPPPSRACFPEPTGSLAVVTRPTAGHGPPGPRSDRPCLGLVTGRRQTHERGHGHCFVR